MGFDFFSRLPTRVDGVVRQLAGRTSSVNLVAIKLGHSKYKGYITYITIKREDNLLCLIPWFGV